MQAGQSANWGRSPDERLTLRHELEADGGWRRWRATDRTGGGDVLLSRLDSGDRSGTQTPDAVAVGVAEVGRLRHPALARVLGWGADQFGPWVAEELGGARPLDDSRCRWPRGERLGESLLHVLEAIAYLHRHGIAHGRISPNTLVSDGRTIVLSGAALSGGGEAAGAKHTDVLQWAELAAKLLDGAGAESAINSGVLAAARPVARGDARGADAARLAEAIRRAADRRAPSAGRPDVRGEQADGPRGASIMTKILHFLGSVLLGVLTMVLTVGVVVGAVALGVMWFVDRLPQEVQVPNVVGLTQQEATARLEQEGLQVGNVRRVYRQDVEAGEIAATLPEPGMMVRQGRETTLVVSLGAAKVSVPRLVGLDMDEAAKVVEEAGLGLVSAGKTRSRAPLGEIVKQTPAPGTRVARGERVTVHLSGGSDFGLIEVEREDEETVRVFFRTIAITVPQGDPLQRVKILEGYGDELSASYDRLHRPGDRIKFETYGRSGKRIEVLVEGERAYRTQL